jgi:hypothetical protein
MRKGSVILILVALVLPVSSVAVPSLANSRIVISSSWILRLPSIDGVFSLGEWSTPQIVMLGPSYPIDGFAYFVNDASTLFVMVDAIGDKTDDASDLSLLIFDFGIQRTITAKGLSGTRIVGFYSAAIGFGSSPNSPTKHKIYEFSIPLSYINGKMGEAVDLSAPISVKGDSIIYDSATGRDNAWPPGVSLGDVSGWGILQLNSGVVGGILLPTNMFAMLGPYLVSVGLVGALLTRAYARKLKH